MRVLILALGNELFGDDCAGFLVADELLSKMPKNLKSIDVIKTSESGIKLLDYFMMDYDYVILIDSIIGDRVGEIVMIEPGSPRRAVAPSPHYYGIPEILNLLEELNEKIPVVKIYGITINKPDIGSPVSEGVRSAARILAELILAELIELLQTHQQASPGDV